MAAPAVREFGERSFSFFRANEVDTDFNGGVFGKRNIHVSFTFALKRTFRGRGNAAS